MGVLVLFFTFTLSISSSCLFLIKHKCGTNFLTFFFFFLLEILFFKLIKEFFSFLLHVCLCVCVCFEELFTFNEHWKTEYMRWREREKHYCRLKSNYYISHFKTKTKSEILCVCVFGYRSLFFSSPVV